MDTKAIGQVIDLMAETGLFFAKADGAYDVKEHKFIEGFISKLSDFGSVDEVKESIEEALNKNITLDMVVADTKALLEGFNLDEKKAITATLAAFIEQVIVSDGVKRETEAKNFEAWEKAIIG